MDEGGAHQTAALRQELPDMTPDDFASFVAGLDSETAKAVSLSSACAAASAPGRDPETRAAWSAALARVLSGTPYTFGLSYVPSYAACDGLAEPADLFKDDWALLATGLPSGGISDARMFFLSEFRLSAAADLSTWGKVATLSSSVRARRLATRHLALRAGELDPADVPAYRAFFVDLLYATDAVEVLAQDIFGLRVTMGKTAAENEKALARLGEVLRSPLTRSAHAQTVCAAYAMTQGDAAAWTQFTESARGADLAPRVARLLNTPDRCLK
jgi:hypothetical protein